MIKSNTTHDCQLFNDAHKLYRELDYKAREHGTLISSIYYYEPNNVWMASCDEYAISINYCPFCGIKLEKNETAKEVSTQDK